MTDAFRTVMVAGLTLAAGLTWLCARALLIPVSSPDRLIAELRLAQLSALLLATIASAYIGFAVAHETRAASSLDVALAVGFFLLAASTLTREPRQALTIVAAGFAAHALVDMGHTAEGLPGGVAPRWYAIGCAIFNVYVGAVTYLPLLRR